MADERVLWVEDKRKRAIVQKLKAQLEEWFCAYVDVLRDGIHEPVTGRGQSTLCGPAARGRQAFHERDSLGQIVQTKEQNLRE